MTRQRALRVGEQLRIELSDILCNELKDPRVGFASIVDVEVSGDIRHAKVYVSVLGPDEERQQTLEALTNARGFFRSELGKRVRLRHIPDISFVLDKSMERGQRINRILREIDQHEDSAGHDNTDGTADHE